MNEIRFNAPSNETRSDFKFGHSGMINHPGTNVPIVETIETELTDIVLNLTDGGPNKSRRIDGLVIDGVTLTHTDRFTTSMAGLLGQSRSVFNLFEPEEVLVRAVDRGIKGEVRVSTVTTLDGRKVALAATRPAKPLVEMPSFMDVLEANGIDLKNIGYSNGELVSSHRPSLPSNFKVAGDEMENMFVLNMPMDGYGMPTSYLAMIRAICANLGVLLTPAFGTKIALGTDSQIDPTRQIERFLESFNNEEGYAAVAERMQSAARVPASLDEYYHINKLLSKAADPEEIPDGVMAASWNRFGLREDCPYDAYEIRQQLAAVAAGGDSVLADSYGLASLDELSAKKRRVLPTKMTVYDLFNFGTEVSTHYLTEGGRRAVNSYLGSMLSKEYDLEGGEELSGNPVDLFFRAEGTESVRELLLN